MTEAVSVSRDTAVRESPAVDLRFAGSFLVGSAGIVAIAIAVTWWLYASWSGPQAMHSEAARLRMQPHAPSNAAALSVRQREERFEYEKRQQDLLSSYSWIDREKGIARIPLDVAMQRLAKHNEGDK